MGNMTKIAIFSILGQITPGNDPGDPPVGRLKIRKLLKRFVMILILYLKHINSV